MARGNIAVNLPMRPKTSRNSESARGLKIVAGLIFIVVGGLLIGVEKPWKVTEDLALDFQAIVTQGIVVISRKTGTEINEHPVYVVWFAFEDSDHIEYRGESYGYESLPQGMEVLVEHLPKDLEVARIQGQSRTVGGYLGAAIVVLLPIVGLIVLVAGLRRG